MPSRSARGHSLLKRSAVLLRGEIALRKADAGDDDHRASDELARAVVKVLGRTDWI